jgi:hypothetical protein
MRLLLSWNLGFRTALRVCSVSRKDTPHRSGDLFAPLYLLSVGMHGNAVAVVVRDLDDYERVIPSGYARLRPSSGHIMRDSATSTPSLMLVSLLSPSYFRSFVIPVDFDQALWRPRCAFAQREIPAFLFTVFLVQYHIPPPQDWRRIKMPNLSELRRHISPRPSHVPVSNLQH